MKRRIIHQSKDPNRYFYLMIIVDVIGIIINAVFWYSYTTGNDTAALTVGIFFGLALIIVLFMTYVLYESENSLWIKGSKLYVRKNEWKVDSFDLESITELKIQGFNRKLAITYMIDGSKNEYLTSFGSMKEVILDEIKGLVNTEIL